MIRMKTIYLIGFMGSGKSTIGTYVEKTYNKSFVDTDSFIEKTYNKKIPVIFKEEGENQFRQYEIEALKTLKNYGVVATGGGIVERELNYQTMHENGIVIYLQTSFKHILKRLEHDASRPLWKQDIKERKALFDRRHELYVAFAKEVLSTDTKSIEEISREIIELAGEE